MCRHIRHREPGIKDKDIVGILRASELGAADGIVNNSVTCVLGFLLSGSETSFQPGTRLS